MSSDKDKGLLWKLPVVRTKQLGKVGPAFGIGAGCGFGFGVGLIGAVDIEEHGVDTSLCTVIRRIQAAKTGAKRSVTSIFQMLVHCETQAKKLITENGAGFGLGLPGLHLGFGFGAACGVGLGFGYGIGRSIAYDDNKKYSNIGKLFTGHTTLPTRDEIIGAVIDKVVISTKKLIQSTFREVDKRRRP